jgi:polyisoprenyl-phosphate glycosyltransferase
MLALRQGVAFRMLPTYSIVVPAYDEEQSIPELIRRLDELMRKLDGAAEVILVDDGSRDRTYELMLEATHNDPRFKAIQLSRNFGHQAAITAGVDFCTGQAVVIMDADLQDPPELVLEMATRWREGFEVVYAVRERREGESAFKRLTARLFYRILRRLTEWDLPADVGDFRLVDRKALNAFQQMRESNRYVRAMFHWVGFRQVGVTYTRAERYAGRSKYPLRKMMKFAVDAIVGFSTAPLRFALKFGFLLSALAFLGAILAIALKLAGAFVVPGWASLTVAITFLSGVQLGMLGMLGEYISRIHDEVRRRPLYLVRDANGFTRHGASMDSAVEEATRPAQDRAPVSPAGTMPRS